MRRERLFYDVVARYQHVIACSAVKECLPDYPATTVVTNTIVGVGGACAKVISALVILALPCSITNFYSGSSLSAVEIVSPIVRSDQSADGRASIGAQPDTPCPSAIAASPCGTLRKEAVGLVQAATPLFGFAVGAALGTVTYVYADFNCMALPVAGVLFLLMELSLAQSRPVQLPADSESESVHPSPRRGDVAIVVLQCQDSK